MKKIDLKILIVFIAVFAIANCGSDDKTNNTPSVQVATPTFSPSAGAVISGTTVTISSTIAGANFYYTTDGSTPACSGTGTPGSTVTVSLAMTIQAIACKSGMADSSLASAAYTVGFTSASAAEADSWQSVTYGAGLFVAVSNDGVNRVMWARY